MPIDRSLFYTINRWPEELRPFFFFLSEATKMMPVVIALTLLLLALVVNKSTRLMALATMVSWPLANGITDVFKAVGRMPRPCVDLPDAIVRVKMLTSFGTASAHSANMAAVATAMWMFGGWRWGLPWAVVAFFTGLSRIYVGVHYPSQVLLGWTCGVFAAFVVRHTVLAYQRLKANREVQASAE